VFVLVNAIAFSLLRPGVPDLWAARARASAAAHGVGLTYWFSWFDGVTPGDYSVMTPYLCARLGTELVAGISAVVIGALTTMLVRDTRHPVAAASVAALCLAINLWCGRVPFLTGTAFAVAALAFVQRRRKLPVAALTVLSVLASPVSGLFVGLGLSGLLLAPRMRDYRLTALVAVASAGGTLIGLAVIFGVPGPEPYPLYLVGEIVLAIGLMASSTPSDHLRITLTIAAAAALVTLTFPNGLGANIARLALFCLPPAAVALSRRRARTLAVVMAPVLVFSGLSSVSALVSATGPTSSASYYAPLASELDRLPSAIHYRLELVHADHAAYTVLLGHAVLARGWETQEDHARNGVLRSSTLDTRSYRAWLDDNAVGYVALAVPSSSAPEVRAVAAARADYLREIWSSAHWKLYKVRHATPIVAEPAVLESSTQSAMTVQVPCACQISVRVRWSRFLAVSPELSPGTSDAVEDSYQPALAQGRSGWTRLTTNRAGTYVLNGSA